MGRSQPKTKSSRTLLRTVLSDIGLRSESTDLGLDILAIGVTSAYFHKVGTVPWLIDELNMEATGRQIKDAHSLSNQFGILSEPVSLSLLIVKEPLVIAAADRDHLL